MQAHKVAAVALLGLIAFYGCAEDPEDAGKADKKAKGTPQLLSAQAPSTHYVNLTFSAPVGSAGSETSSYVIRDGSGALLPVTAADVGGGGTLVTLTTAAQQATDYQLLLAMDLGIGSAGFTGSIEGEPYLDSAIALGDTSIQLTFSERLDRQFAENAASYHLVDPDTDQDVDIVISAARLNDDLRTVVLTTTPQENRLYTVQVTNVKARFSCADGDVSVLDAAATGMVCAQTLRPITKDGAKARLELTARTGVDRMQPTNPTAPGTVGTIQTSTTGAGVGTAACTGNPCAASAGTSANEEITLKFDVPTRADSVVLGVTGLRMAQVVLYVSSASAAGFDFTIPAADVSAVTVGDGSEIHLDRLSALPANLMIDQVRMRALAASSCLADVCVSDGRIIDPTRSNANFYGIPTVDNTPPRVVEAKSVSATSVLVTFSEPLDSEAADPTHFTISPNLVVTGAIQTEYQTQVLLTTTRQVADTQYTVTVSGVRDRARNALDPAASSAMFRGISRELYLATAIARSPTEVLLTFSEPMDRTTTENIANYDIADPDEDSDIDIRITGATASADGRTVVITTTPQQNTVYEITVTNIRAIRDDFYLDPMRNTATFHGIPPADSVPPVVVSVVSASDTSLLVTFSEPITIESADPANFIISPALAVLSAELTGQENQVLLTTAPQQADVTYTVTVRNVKDKAGNVIVVGAGNTATVVFNGTPETANGNAAPRVAGAASTSNTTVVVTFTKAMSTDAIIAGNYAIVQVNVNPEVGAVSVVSARFLGTDGTAVELTTRPQNEVTYQVTVTNVRDRAGNQLAPRELQAAVAVDPRSATFAGSPWSCGPRVCDNGSTGLGEGQCGNDDDCSANGECTPLDTDGCRLACKVQCSAPDPDGDGLADNDEQRGWVVKVKLANGQSFERQVTSNPDVEDTDGDELSDSLERLIGLDPRDTDTDDDLISDYDEYNILYSDAASQDTDGDGMDDMLESEFYKTNALVADSDGDGYGDNDELFATHRNPRIADLPENSFEIGNVKLALDQRFTYTDAEGNTRAETLSSASTLEQNQSSGTIDLSQTVGHWLLGIEGGLNDCQSDCAKEWADTVVKPSIWNRFRIMAHVEGGMEFTSAHTEESSRATSSAFQQAVQRGNELSVSNEAVREVLGASISVDVTFHNPSNVAITLRNVELRASTSDPNDPTSLTPVATLVAESTLMTGQPLVLNIGPGQTRGAIVFQNRDVFPAVVEDLMRSPRGIIFNIANYDLETGDQRNFAYGLQVVRERTIGIRIDKGDGSAKALRVIASGALNRPRDDLRCAETGSTPGQLCSVDGDCAADSRPCEGGSIVGGFSEFDGVSGPTPLPLDFVLQDTLGMRKTRPAVILAGGTVARSLVKPFTDDVQVVPPNMTVAPGAVVVAPGRDGVLESVPVGTDYNSEGMRVLAGDNGTAQTTATGDDIQLIAVNTFPLAPGAVVVAAGPNGVIDSAIDPKVNDDEVVGPDGIRAGEDGSVQSFAQGDDVQLIPVGTRGVPSEAVAISGGENGVLDSRTAGDDVRDVVSGYEVSRTCDASTPFRILRGRNLQYDTPAEDGVCTVAFAPHFVGEECSADADCGADTGRRINGRCAGDVLVNAGEVGVRPGSAGFLDSVPLEDDVYVGPGIACTVDADCTADGVAGSCNGTQQVVRIDERRNGQYRRAWMMLTSDDEQLQTDFSALRVRAGDEISLAFVQDIDRDGLVAQTEFLFGSSDYRKDTDDDELSDFSEIIVGWDVGVEGEPLRHVQPDPRRKDSDGDGLSDKEELDLRPAYCACNARGPKSLFGSGKLLSTATPTAPEQGRPCNADADCRLPGQPLVLGSCKDATDCTPTVGGGWTCPVCTNDATLSRTDPRARDTDSDLVSDHSEVFGYLTGAGVVDPQQRAGVAGKFLVLAGADRRADTEACPGNYCIDDINSHCRTDGDCAQSRTCVHTVACDDVQVVPVGTRVDDPRTVVAIVAASASRDLADEIATRVSTALSESRLGGDDVLIAGMNQSVIDRSVPADPVCEDGGQYLFCSAIKPGADGVVSSIVGGNDSLVLGGTGQRLELTNPLSPDSDQDLYSDGFEQRLGSSPNVPGDASFSGDLDEDGLTDSMERIAHNVSVALGGRVQVTQQTSEVLLPDTDFDGLPDYAERNMPCASEPLCLAESSAAGSLTRCTNTGEECNPLAAEPCPCIGGACACPTNPNSADTDGDGIDDLDELSAEQLELLAAHAQIFPGYIIDREASAQLGTDPGRSDADGDGRSDYFELYTGWLVQRYDGTVARVFSDPTIADSDGDGMNDGDEWSRGIDPRDPDTDDDGRIDGIDAQYPNRPDLSVTVTYAALQMVQPNEAAEWLWGLYVQGPGQPFPGSRVSNGSDCPVPLKNNCQCETDLRDLPLNKSINITLAPGEAFVLNGALAEVYEDSGRSCPGGITDPYQLTAHSDDGRYLHFIEQPVTYEALVSRQFTSRSIQLSSMNGGIAVTAFVEIFVNCEGSARRICRPGSTCLSNADCESNNCTNGVCVDLCGNGTTNTPLEVCDDGNDLECGTCSAQCDVFSATPAARCPTGVRCNSPATCASNSCLNGRCAPSCGDGVRDAGEACDDNNNLECGTCNASCGGAGTGATCLANTRCNADADCTGTCNQVTRLCVAPPPPPPAP